MLIDSSAHKGFLANPYIKYEGTSPWYSLFEKRNYDGDGNLLLDTNIHGDHITRVNFFFNRPGYMPPFTVFDYLAYAFGYVNSSIPMITPEFRYYADEHKEVMFFNMDRGMFFDMLSRPYRDFIEYFIKRYNSKHADVWRMIVNKEPLLYKYAPAVGNPCGIEQANLACIQYYGGGKDWKTWSKTKPPTPPLKH